LTTKVRTGSRALIIHPGVGIERVEKVLTLVLDLLVGLSFLVTKPDFAHALLERRHIAFVLVREAVDLGPPEPSGRGERFRHRWCCAIVFVVVAVLGLVAFASPVGAAHAALLECWMSAASERSDGPAAGLPVAHRVAPSGVERDERRFA